MQVDKNTRTNDRKSVKIMIFNNKFKLKKKEIDRGKLFLKIPRN